MTTSVESSYAQEAPYVPGFSPVSLSLIRVMGECHCDVFKAVSWSSTPVLFCSGNHTLSVVQMEELSHRNLGFLFVRNADSNSMQADLRANLPLILEREDVPLVDRYNIVQQIVVTEMNRLYRVANLEKSIEDFYELGGSISSLISADDVIPAQLFAIAKHSIDTFTHIINVASYCTLCAKSLGITVPSELKAIAVGGLLHDIGKRFMPQRLLNKASSHNEEERELIRTHPQKGYEELCQFERIDSAQLMMVYQHHEHNDGKGYPVGITGEEMHLWAKICATVDVFEALTGKRPYRKPKPAFEVIDYLKKSTGKQFDTEIVQCWSATIHNKS